MNSLVSSQKLQFQRQLVGSVQSNQQVLSRLNERVNKVDVRCFAATAPVSEVDYKLPPKQPNRVPAGTPPFTLSDLKNAIPKHCFERPLYKSLGHLAFDVGSVAAMMAAGIFYWNNFAGVNMVMDIAFFSVYCFFQGAVMTGIWMLGHECGHGAFSDNRPLNDTVGFFLHSYLLTPFFSWKFSHSRHHSFTGNVAKDEAYVPSVKSHDYDKPDPTQHGPVRLIYLAYIVFLGWPSYLLFNASAHKQPKWASHFHPTSPIFKSHEGKFVLLSDVGLVTMAGILAAWGASTSFAQVAVLYGIPYVVVNFWLTIITLLHHTHPALPHYEDSEWNFLKGALCTVDRSFGKMLDFFFHHISDTHVTHHLFSSIPFYHAEEATEAIKPILGDYYLRDDRSVHAALWNDYGDCSYVAPDNQGEGTLWYRSGKKAEQA